MNVLSLFDGVACGRVALERANIKVDKYYSSEVDTYAIQVANKNWPQDACNRLGDVTKWREWDIDWSSIDLVIGGSPCTGFSFAGKQLNFEDPRSKLFFEYSDILNHIKKFNPNVKFLLENVKMKQEYQDTINDFIGIKPMAINSGLVSAQNRARLYWFNWQANQPEDRNIYLQDVLLDGENKVGAIRGRYVDKEKKRTEQKLELRKDNKSNCLTTVQKDNVAILDKYLLSDEYVKRFFNSLGNTRNKKFPTNGNCKVLGTTVADTANGTNSRHWVFDPTINKMGCLTATDYKQPKQIFKDDILRKLTPVEYERLQTLPDGYTEGVSNTQRYKELGNGWTVEVIAHLLKELKKTLDLD